MKKGLKKRELKTTTHLMLVSFFLFFAKAINCQKLIIHNASEFVQFANDIPNKDTVLLDSDIDFNGFSMPVIGSAISKYFNGIFDGQGHTISNLNISSSDSQYVGLFGHSERGTFKNVVFDESCSFTSTYDSSNTVYIGSILGHCYSDFSSLCNIEGTVNMGSVTFNGNTQINLYAGGIVGYLPSQYTQTFLKNCVNYGNVWNTGLVHNSGYLGGIAGYCQGSGPSTKLSIQNCANYGALENKNTSSTQNFYIGGTVGYAYYYVHIENCMSGGLLYSAVQNTYIGSFVGYAFNTQNANITRCFWSKDVDGHNITGKASSTDTKFAVPVTNTFLTEMNTTTLGELNKYVTDNPDKDMSKWITLHMNGGSIINSDYETLIVTQRKFPEPFKEGNSFLSWFTDNAFTQMYNSSASNEGIYDLYAYFVPNNYTVTFSFGNGTITTKNVTYGQCYGTLPGMTDKEGHSIKWFRNEDFSGEEFTTDTIVRTAGDHTLYGHFVPNTYTATFLFWNGTKISYPVTFNETITYPENLVREGYKFNGWEPNGITRMPANDITFTANWTEITPQISSSSSSTIQPSSSSAHSSSTPSNSQPQPYSSISSSGSSTLTPTEFVKIVFGTKDLSEKDIKEIIEKYTDGNEYEMEITAIDDDTTTVIIKFVDSEKAENFVEQIKTGSNMNVIKDVGFSTGFVSFSTGTVPSLFLHFLI